MDHSPTTKRISQGRVFIIYLIVFCYLVFWASASLASQQDKDEAIAHLSGFIQDKMSDEDVPGLSISIIHDQSTWFSQGFGQADVDTERKVSSETRFRLGGLTSIFTAMLILKLEQNGLLSLDDAVSKYFPKLSFPYYDGSRPPITIKELLTHHSGLPINIWKGSWASRPENFQHLFSQPDRLFLSQLPNSIYSYSNVGYDLLGMIIEKVTGMRFEQALNKMILNPMGLKNTYFATPDKKDEKLATGYKKGKKKRILYPRDLPSVGLVSSTVDINKLAKQFFAILNGKQGVLSKSQLEKMFLIQNLQVAADLGRKVSLAWLVGGMGFVGGGQAVWRAGATLYQRSRIVLLPERKLAVIVFANDSGAWESVEEISEKAMAVALENIFTIKPVASDKANKSPVVYGVPDDFAEAYSSIMGYIPVKTEDIGVSADLLGWKIRAKPDDGSWYKLQYDLFGLIPINLSWITKVKIAPAKITGKRVLIALYKGVQQLFASEVQLPDVTSVWLKRLGTYRLANPDELSKSMEISEGKLIVEKKKLFFLYKLPIFIGMQLKIPMQILDDKKAIIPGLGTALNEPVNVVHKNGQELLEFSGYLLKKQ